MIPPKLKTGDEIRIIAPSRSMALIPEAQQQYVKRKLESMSFKVSFGKHVQEKDEFVSSSIRSRVADIHDAFRDKNVKCVMTVIGGFNSNQLLPYLDYTLIKRNPKIFIGYSDITALQNAFLAKSGLVTYYGPHFSTFGAYRGNEYTEEYFKNCLMQEKPFAIVPSKEWSDDAWWSDQEHRNFIKNDGWWVINKGKAEGTIIGGNLSTFFLLQGAPYMPSLKNVILFIEDDELAGDLSDLTFDRNLESLLQQKGAKIKGVVIGRFQKKSAVKKERLIAIIKAKQALKSVPVIANVDFGHTSPMITFPIGGTARITAGRQSKIEILKH